MQNESNSQDSGGSEKSTTNLKALKVQKKNHSLVRSGLQLSLITLLSRILGLVREMTKAAFLGTGPLADAFNFAFALPNFFRRLFAENSISVAFIPTFRAYIEDCKTDEDKRRTQEFLRATLTLVTFLTAIVVSAGIIFAPFIVRLFYSGEAISSGNAAMSETVLLTRVMFPYLLIISVAAFFQGILNAENIFAPSGFTPVLFNTIVISATYLLSSRFENPARAMSLGVITGGTIQAIFQLPFVFRTGWRVGFTSLKKCFSNEGTRRVVKLILPTIVGMAAYQLNDFVSASLAGRAGTGVYSAIQYSLRLQELILGIFAVSIGTVILPDLAGLSRRGEYEKFSDMLLTSLKIIALIAIPVTFYSLVSGREIIALLFRTRAFDENSVTLTLSVFRWHIAGLFFIAVNRVLAQAFYAQKNTKLPTLAGVINFGVNILLAIALVGKFGGRGIAAALSVASAVNSLMLFIFLAKMRTINTLAFVREIVLYALKICAFALAAGAAIFFARPYIISMASGHNRLISSGVPVVATALIFAVIGIIFLIITKDKIAQAASKSIVKKLRRKK